MSTLLALAGDIELNPGYRSLVDVRKTRGLKIAHLNIRSLRQKTDMIRLEGLDNKTFDVLTMSETWLNGSFRDAKIALPGVTCIRLDRSGDKTGYGGVAAHVREGLPFRVRNGINSDNNECLWIELNRAKCRPTLICCAYRAPEKDLSEFISNLYNAMTSIDLDKCDLLLLGDINVNILPHSKGSIKKDKQQLLNFSRTLDLSQLIKEPTRVTEKSRTLIDLVLVNNEHRTVDSGVIPVSLSHHYLIYSVLKASVTKAPPRTIEYRSYKYFDTNSFKKDLEGVTWHLIENEDNIDNAVCTWNKLFLESQIRTHQRKGEECGVCHYLG